MSDFSSKVGPSIFDLHTGTAFLYLLCATHSSRHSSLIRVTSIRVSFTCYMPHTLYSSISVSLLVLCHTFCQGYTTCYVWHTLHQGSITCYVSHTLPGIHYLLCATHSTRDPLHVMCHTLFQGFITCYVPHNLPGIHYLLCATHYIRGSLLVMCDTLYARLLMETSQ